MDWFIGFLTGLVSFYALAGVVFFAIIMMAKDDDHDRD